MTVQIEDIEPGNVICVKSEFGHGPVVYGTVRCIDASNRVIDYTTGNKTYWCYITQVIEVTQS